MGLPSQLEWCLERLAPLGRLRVRRMFGGWGVYCDEVFFAIEDRGELWFKADDQTEAEFRSLGLEPFSYSPPFGRPQTLRYFPLPAAAFDDDAKLLRWARLALAAGWRARKAAARR